jgi:hypothetical protein
MDDRNISMPNGTVIDATARPSYYVEGATVPLGDFTEISNIAQNSGSTDAQPTDLTSFESDVESIKLRLNDAKIRLDGYANQQKELFSIHIDNQDQLNGRKFTIERLSSEADFWRKQYTADTELLSSIYKTTEDRARLISIKSTSPVNVRDHHCIPSKELPIFNIKRNPLFADGSENIVSDHDTISLDGWIRKFERIYLNYNVDIKQFWFFHLEACLEKSDLDYTWFNQNVKAGYLQDKSKYTWEYAKDLLKKRFDLNHSNGIAACNHRLIKLRQKYYQSSSAYMDKITYLTGNTTNLINLKLNYFFTLLFISTLFTAELQDKVRAKFVDYMKLQLYQHSSMRSIHATDDEQVICDFYSDFTMTVEAIRFHMKYLEG